LRGGQAISPLNDFAENVHSQNGEDGIIAELLRRLKISDPGWCVEFGAWDGMLNSNTFALVERGWRAIYIEADPQRFHDLGRTAARYPTILPIQAFVSERRGDPRSLDAILSRTNLPTTFEILSIDIDSFDADVWENTVQYSPLIVVIEINSSIPPGPNVRHAQSGAGNSFTATVEIARSKNYTLVCHTGNLIFVRNDRVEDLSIPSQVLTNPDAMFLRTWIGFKDEPPTPRRSVLRRFLRRLGLSR
jgi:hypothetical protein